MTDNNCSKAPAAAPEGATVGCGSVRTWRGAWVRVCAWMLFAVLLGACSKDDPAAVLKRELGQMQAAVEQHKPAEFLRFVSDDFSGQSGQVDRQSLRGLLLSQLMGNEKISVTLGSPDITLHGERATVKVSALVVGGRYVPERGQTLQIESGWELKGGEWKCYAATWE